jgi:hypothetical protein
LTVADDGDEDGDEDEDEDEDGLLAVHRPLGHCASQKP